MGIPLEKMVIYDPTKPKGALTDEQIRDAKVILWHGFCSVHQGFTTSQIKNVKKESPETTVIVHPECRFDVVQEADLNGSTAYIIDTIRKAPEGSKFAVGTEINLVNRLANQYTNKKIFRSPPISACVQQCIESDQDGYLQAFAIKEGTPINVIQVREETQRDSLLALDRMMNIS